jgi:hypothetical protein
MKIFVRFMISRWERYTAASPSVPSFDASVSARIGTA